MAGQKEKVLLAWGGGKDSIMALHELRRHAGTEIIGLVTGVSADDGQGGGHGFTYELAKAQARALELPLTRIEMKSSAPPKDYWQHFATEVRELCGAGSVKVAFGDLFLDDIRDLREEALEAVGIEAIFPLWHRETKELSYAFIGHRYKAIVTCVDQRCLDATFAGRAFDRSFLADLPIIVDPCGENGEFHTFVYDGPAFSRPITLKIGESYVVGDQHWCSIGTRRPRVAKAAGDGEAASKASVGRGSRGARG